MATKKRSAKSQAHGGAHANPSASGQRPQINPPKGPQHLLTFLENVNETVSLLEVHKRVAGAGPGRKRDVEVLNKSAIVLAVACWEVYVEDLAAAALQALIDQGPNPEVLPESLRVSVGSKYSGPKAWQLAGEGWKDVMRDNLAELVKKNLALNTPKTKEVEKLFSGAIGLQGLTTRWGWPGRSAHQASVALDSLVSLRGDIAHRVKASRSVHKQDVRNAVDLVSRLAARTNNEVRKFLATQLTGSPSGKVRGWATIQYNGVK